MAAILNQDAAAWQFFTPKFRLGKVEYWWMSMGEEGWVSSHFAINNAWARAYQQIKLGAKWVELTLTRKLIFSQHLD
jgi:hypothetical protein